jgi:hypothetical protein
MDIEIAENLKKGQMVTFKDGRGTYPLASDPETVFAPDLGIYFKLEGLPENYHCRLFEEPSR